MNVTTIRMLPEQAKEKLKAYRQRSMRSAAAHVREEYAAAVEAYAALADGKDLIDVDQVIRDGGFDAKMRPKLAIAGSDRRQVRFRWDPRRTIAEFDTHHYTQRGPITPRMGVAVELGRLHERWNATRQYQISVEGYALVPHVPADVLPVVSDLRRYFTLWEVEAWADTSLLARPDRDPYLLQHVHGSLYAVVAHWDLTDLERAVMSGRNRTER